MVALHRPAPSGVRLEGSALTEVTSTSSTAVDLTDVTGLSIPVTNPIHVEALVRKASGASSNFAVGLTLNSAEVLAPVNFTGTADETFSGLLEYRVGSRAANYLRAGWLNIVGVDGAGNMTKNDLHAFVTADMPNAVITDITMRAKISGGATMAAAQMRVYSFRA